MLSVILYGRNDAHGYNLHKRGALSLNAIAEVLTGDTDEIIFVDYNTPDELPTFPEAIADTLTDRCKQRLRILRVRSSYHAQFVGKTRLVALECQSRNIAVRRSNPANRWILSTNTDMIFWPNTADASLTTAVADLEDNFYHLPRFEVPEGFWERLDRQQPLAAIQAMREAGTRFHLNEVVLGSYDNLYEGPGDFQLFLRQDLFDIAGFDERMILGWHADTNIARRMRLLRGSVQTAFDRVYGYHCGHTRQATSLHGGNRTENSLDQFVKSVTDPVARHQEQTWGAPDIDIEEIRLTTPEVYLEAMSAAVPQTGPQHSEAVYNATSYDAVVYDTDHVLPHLCDVMFNLPAGQTIFFFGDDIRLLEGVRDFLEAAGKAPRFVLTDLANAPRIEDMDSLRWADVVRPFSEAAAEATLFLVQYPRGDAEPAAARRELEWYCQRVLSAIAQLERTRPAHLRRRIITVNSLHNRFFNLVESTLAPSVMPFSSRLRQGFVVDDRSARSLKEAPEWPIYERLGRTYPFLAEDWDMLDRLLEGLRAGQPMKGWERLAPELAALAAAPPLLRDARGVTEAEALSWGEKADTAMRRQLSRLAQAPEAVPARPDVSNRLLSGSDWDAADWARLAQTYFGAGVMSFAERKRWVWERVTLAMEIQRQIPAHLNRADAAEQPRILFLADEPDLLSQILVHLGYRVSFVSSDTLVNAAPGVDWRTALDLSWLSLPPNLEPFDPNGPKGHFVGLVATKPSLFEKSAHDVDAILAAADPFMADGAVLLAASTVQLNENAFLGGFGIAEWQVLYEPAGPLGSRGFAPAGEVDLRVPLDTVSRFALEDDPQESVYGLSYGLVNTFNTSVLISARWPRALQPGPAERMVWSGGLIDPGRVAIPYGAHATPDSADTRGYQSLNGLAGRAFRAIETAPIILGSQPRNVLPFTLADPGASRSPMSLSLPVAEDGGPCFALCMEAGGARRLVIEATDDAGGSLSEASALVHGIGPNPVALEGGRAVLTRDEGFWLVSVVLRYDGGPARLTRVTAWVEP